MDETKAIYIIAVTLLILRALVQFYILYRIYLFIKGFEKFSSSYLLLQDKILNKGDDSKDATK